MLRRLLDLPLLVLMTGITALSMWLPASYAVIHSDYRTARAFFYSGVIVLVLTGLIAIATANRRPRNPVRASLAALVLAYLVLPLVMALPLHEAVRDTRFLNAWFEMVSSFTTTGATLYEPARLPDAVHLWRAQVGWMGGFFILVAGIAILAPMNLGGVEVVSGRVPGRSAEGLSQITHTATPARRMALQAVAVLPAYLGLTLVLWAVLAMAGDRSLVAFSHAMSTVSTSGITPLGDMTAGPSGIYGELAIFVVLVAALSRRAWPGAALYQRGTPLWQDPELRLGLGIVAVLPVLLFLRHWIATAGERGGIGDALHALWGGAFTTLSFLTTTGFVSADWRAATGWSGLGTPGLVMAGLAIFGGGIATTAGGVKLLRVYALFRHGQREMERLVHPSSVGGSGASMRRLRREGAYLAWIFFILFACAIGVATAALTLVGVEFEPAMIFAVAALTSTGPLPSIAASEPLVYASLGAEAKVLLAAVMVLGRVELLAILVLLAPDGWRR
ncbi:TrkH family potassium uptake protein [Paragemmobacter straminiformis]|uniref:TrkH family potassium uptake protein n=1 Tax=Paragemmobacter straminiformis TaxID=2045119 RepID=A0A842I7G0_9RHOB|nr:TrkH family potassium uptake protein [Gemmobacter straminiformis]MBC2835501.1 TrkH family potassium uptake protein [Gemmobacter straminiformis]